MQQVQLVAGLDQVLDHLQRCTGKRGKVLRQWKMRSRTERQRARDSKHVAAQPRSSQTGCCFQLPVLLPSPVQAHAPS